MKKEYLKYLIKKCIRCLEALKTVNTELKKEENKYNEYLSTLSTSTTGYLIVAVASLFDRDGRSISLYNLFDEKIDNIKENTIIEEIIKVRNKFVAHNDFRYLDDGQFGLSPIDIINSNLKELLEQYKNIIEKS